MYLFKRFAGLSAGALLLISFTTPASASALTQPQISAIISLLQSFGADQSVISNVSAALGGTTPPAPTSCITLSNSLYLGQTDSTTNGDVSRLQQFLGGIATSVFDAATETLVQQWQSAHTIVSSGTPDTTGFGYVGPRTRAAMACGSNQTPSGSGGSTIATATQSVPTVATTSVITPAVSSSAVVPTLPATSTTSLVTPTTPLPSLVQTADTKMCPKAPNIFEPLGQVNTSYVCTCPAITAPTTYLWGGAPSADQSNVYSNDSDVCAAALQRGVITTLGGVIRYMVLSGQNSYPATTKNGVTSFVHTAASGSFTITGGIATKNVSPNPPTATLNPIYMRSPFVTPNAIKGSAENISMVSLTIDGSVYPQVVVYGGQWSQTIPTPLQYGTHPVTVTDPVSGAVLTTGTYLVYPRVVFSGNTTSTDGNFVISGTATGVDALKVSVAEAEGGREVWNSGVVHVTPAPGGVGDPTWFVQVLPPLRSGSYNVTVFDANKVVPVSAPLMYENTGGNILNEESLMSLAPVTTPTLIASWSGPQQFNGINQSVSLPAPVSLPTTFSIVTWVNPSSLTQQSFGTGDGGTVVDAAEDGVVGGVDVNNFANIFSGDLSGISVTTETFTGGDGYAFGIAGPDTKLFQGHEGQVWWWTSCCGNVFSGDYNDKTRTVPLNTWTQVAITSDSINTKIYINGVLKNTALVGARSTPKFTKIGGRSWKMGAFSGSIRSVGIYSGVLTPSQLAQL